MKQFILAFSCIVVSLNTFASSDYPVYSNLTNDGAGINRKNAYKEMTNECLNGDVEDIKWIVKSKILKTEYGYYQGTCTERNITKAYKVVEVFSNDTNDYSGDNLQKARQELVAQCPGEIIMQQWVTTSIFRGTNYGYIFGLCNQARAMN
ncbi:MAG: hypothetical protein PHY93_20625 [Bacteriovorax sp.]|nr:hypothetical protein [Bacteriovorax sp.]